MYKPDFTLLKELFPNAELAIDWFHVVQNIGHTFLTDRIQQMNPLNRKKSRRATIQVFKEVLEIAPKKCLIFGGAKTGLAS